MLCKINFLREPLAADFTYKLLDVKMKGVDVSLEAIFEVVCLITAGKIASVNIFITSKIHLLLKMWLTCLDLQLLMESDA